jgi:hypothetical protein
MINDVINTIKNTTDRIFAIQAAAPVMPVFSLGVRSCHTLFWG